MSNVVKGLRVLAAMGLLLSALGLVANAQAYSFSVEEAIVDVYVQSEGYISLLYQYRFDNDPGASPIEFVDIGLPSNTYDLGSIQAWAGDTELSHIARSTYISQGIEVGLGGQAIPPGESGSVRVWIPVVQRVLYPADPVEGVDYTGLVFSPNWFDPQAVHGTGYMQVNLHLPPGVQPEEAVYFPAQGGWPEPDPQASLDEEGRVVYTWEAENAEMDEQYFFGASFPSQYVDQSAVVTEPTPRPGAPAPGVPSGGIGAAISDLISGVCGASPILCFFAFIVGIFALSAVGQKSRMKQYLPPSMKVEGHDIKRGLTAVEAAVLLETPLNKVMTMIMFGLVKKGAVTVLTENPLTLQPTEPRPEGLQEYEKLFLDAVDSRGQLKERDLRDMMVRLIKSVGTKMKGFSRRESVAYYKSIVASAWQQVETADTPEVKSRIFDEALEWTMMDENFNQRTQTAFSGGPVFLPPWWLFYRPWHSMVPGGAAAAGRAGGGALKGEGARPSAPGGGRGQVSMPTLPGSAFAAGVVTSVQGAASRIIGNLTGFTSGVTTVTNPPPPPSRSGGYRGGGGSCACACACAGCACACAGGGR